MSKRPETGVMRFELSAAEDDWPGVFIRGDDAFAHSQVLVRAVNGSMTYLDKLSLVHIIDLLRASNIADPLHPKKHQVAQIVERPHLPDDR